MEFVRDEEKDLIVRNRPGGGGIGFEDVVRAFINKKVLHDGPNDNAVYSDQGMMIIEIRGYTYKAPYIQLSQTLRKLITIYPCRKFKSYL